VIIDGLHRAYHAKRSDIPAIQVVVIEGALPPLPADVLEWDEVILTDLRLPRWEKFRNFNESMFRKVKQWIDPPSF